MKPYFGLRSYQDAGVHYEGQIGSEATPAEFLDALLAATREMVRVLKPSGSIFVNLGDKYSGAQGQTHGNAQSTVIPQARFGAIPNKSLMGIPWRYAIACIDELGLILRAEIIWSKPNGLPESVTDRVRRSHEQWFHFTKQPRYYSSVDEIREEHTGTSHGGGKSGFGNQDAAGVKGIRYKTKEDPAAFDPRGKLPGSVWSIPTQPLTVPPELGVDHFAAYPMEWPRRIIMGWTPNGICTACGEGRRPTTDVQYLSIGDSFAGGTATAGRHRSGTRMGDGALATITGYVCSCSTPKVQVGDEWVEDPLWNLPSTTPAIVLDPFGGTGTTALVAKALGRTGITIDLSADYCRLAQWRCNDPRELAAALQVEKPEPVHPDQLDLLSGIE